MKKYFLVYLIMFMLFFSPLVLASPDAQSEFFEILNRILNFLFWVAMIVSIFVVLFAAYQFLFSEGNPEAVAKAKKNILYSIIAIALAVLAKSSSIIIIEIIGLEI
jgi:hypothetical protein